MLEFTNGSLQEITTNKFEQQKNAKVEKRYSPLTLYLMGLLPPEAVPSIPLIRPFDTTIEKLPSFSVPTVIEGTRIFISMQDIIGREGKWEVVPDNCGSDANPSTHCRGPCSNVPSCSPTSVCTCDVGFFACSGTC